MDQSDISNYAELDFDRSGRCGFPEFIYGAGKTAEQIAGIMRKLEQSEVPVLATRVSGESAAAVCREIPEAEYDELARTLCIRRFIRPHRGHIAVICAGTSDLPVAREALVTLEICELHERKFHSDLLLPAVAVDYPSVCVLLEEHTREGRVIGPLVHHPVRLVDEVVARAAGFHKCFDFLQ